MMVIASGLIVGGSIARAADHVIPANYLYLSLDEMKDQSIKAIQQFYLEDDGSKLTAKDIYPVTFQGVKLNAEHNQIEEIVLESGTDVHAEDQGGVGDLCEMTFKKVLVHSTPAPTHVFKLTNTKCFQYD